MKIAAITRFKHGGLFQLLKELGWTQAEFARRCKTDQGKMGAILNLTHRPSEQMIIRMETAFGEVGKFVDVASMFPDSYIGFKRPLNVIQIQDVEPHKLEWIRQSQVSLLQDAQPPVASDLLDTKERLAIIATFLDKVDTPLTEQERDMIEEHIVKGIAYRTVARKHGYTHGESVRQIVNRGLRKIRDYFEQRDNPHSFLNASIRHELDEPAHNHSK